MLRFLIPAAVGAIAWAQAPAPAPSAPPLAFEVATIRPARSLQDQALSGKMHVGEKIDGARADYGSVSIADLVMLAFKVKAAQVSGPDWIKTERFDILAKLPEGATKDQVPQMLQSLLADRFKLTFHRETKDQAVYALVVAKGGPKLKESPPDNPAPAPDPNAPPPKEEKGAMNIQTSQGNLSVKQDSTGTGATIKGPNGLQQKISIANGIIHIELNKSTISDMADAMARFLDKPIVDMTDLKGNYQVSLDVSMQDAMKVARAAGFGVPAAEAPVKTDEASDPGSSTIFQSVQAMGLKLEPRKAPLEFIVIDHVEKTPTEN
jgi:uncharacterized protein (TIGR03435 family)